MKEKILELLKGINANIEDGIDLVEEGIVDSFEVVNIVTELEDFFDIEIEPSEVVAENFQTVDTVVSLVERLTQK